jgi:hypothetical protein
MTDLHDVVKLLIARMESHPEEFERGMSRWGWMLEGVMTNCSEEERAALHAGLRPIRLKQLHEDVMDELLNGDERRRKETEEIEYEQKLQRGLLQRQALQQQLALKQQDVTRLSQYPNHADMEKNGIMNALRNLYARL